MFVFATSFEGGTRTLSLYGGFEKDHLRENYRECQIYAFT